MEATGWLHVGDVDLHGLKGSEGQRRARALLPENGFAETRDEDLRLDLVCGRNQASWLRVYVRETPSQPRPKKKPRHP